MGGTIAVESELGAGTTFTLYLDFERVEKEDVKKAMDNQSSHQNALTHALPGKKILLTEDHPLNAEIARKLLEKAGCSVTWVQNGQQCVDTFSESTPNAFDLILMDIRMPVMNGLEAAKQIRALARADAKSIPIVAMTANAYDEDVKKSLDAGMNAHLAKPIAPTALYETMARVLPEKEHA